VAPRHLYTMATGGGVGGGVHTGTGDDVHTGTGTTGAGTAPPPPLPVLHAGALVLEEAREGSERSISACRSGTPPLVHLPVARDVSPPKA
jgi:hypothetical protein